jgi:hypothetical protein
LKSAQLDRLHVQLGKNLPQYQKNVHYAGREE